MFSGSLKNRRQIYVIYSVIVSFVLIFCIFLIIQRRKTDTTLASLEIMMYLLYIEF